MTNLDDTRELKSIFQRLKDKIIDFFQPNEKIYPNLDNKMNNVIENSIPEVDNLFHSDSFNIPVYLEERPIKKADGNIQFMQNNCFEICDQSENKINKNEELMQKKMVNQTMRRVSLRKMTLMEDTDCFYNDNVNADNIIDSPDNSANLNSDVFNSQSDIENLNIENKSLNLKKLKKILKLKTKPFLIKEWNGFTKIAEATYSEVFSKDGLIYKIIPFVHTIPENFYKEVYILKQLSENTTGNGANIKDAYMVRGKFPKTLLKEWIDFRKNRTSENLNPKQYPLNQIYGVIVLEDGGIDLEKVELGEEDVMPLFRDLISQLAFLEEKFRFEHRDLHWGNILLQKYENNGTTPSTRNRKKSNSEIQTPNWKYKVNMIDFSLSRFEDKRGLVFVDLKEDNSIFAGDPEEEQFNVYRWIRKANKNNWIKFNPESNVIWLRYLINKMALKVGDSKNLMKIMVLSLGKKSAKEFLVEFNKTF